MRRLRNPAKEVLFATAVSVVWGFLPCGSPLAAQTNSDETQSETGEADRWADAMRAFARQDAEHPYPAGEIVFVGSSSIRLWDLPKSFPQLEPAPLNRGFGGSEISDAIRHFDLLVGRHQPRLVVMYAGDNDIAGGKSPEQVHADFLQFAKQLREALPETDLAYIAIKPSIRRWKLAEEMTKANAAIRATCDQDDQLTFIDIWQPMLGADGRPREELFVADGLHLNQRGYELWTREINAFLTSESALP